MIWTTGFRTSALGGFAQSLAGASGALLARQLGGSI
jgi:hypothetical protein